MEEVKKKSTKGRKPLNPKERKIFLRFGVKKKNEKEAIKLMNEIAQRLG